MKVFILEYKDSYYPEDNTIIGVYSSYEKAEKALEETLYNATTPHTKTKWRYTILEEEVQ